MIGSELRVKDIMSAPVLTVNAADTLREIVETFSARHVHGAPVLEGEAVVGVVSISDILEFLATTPAVPTERSAFAEWGEVEMEEPEVDDDSSRAFYTDFWDDAGADVSERFDNPESPEWDLLREQTAGAVMTRKLECVSPETYVTAAARRLIESGVHRLLVMRDGELEGILSATDFVRLVADSKF